MRLGVRAVRGRARRPLSGGLLIAALVPALAAPCAAAATVGAGGVLAFGYNATGQLGNTANNGTSEPNPSPAPVALPGQVGAVTQLAVGGKHSLVLTAGGQLYAFGYNRYGQLGSTTNNATNNPNPIPSVVAVPGFVTQIAAGGVHSLAATAGGQLYAFGANGSGQLGNAANNGTSNPNPTPEAVTLPGQSGAVAQLAAGTEHSLVLTTSGQLYAFGSNAYGQLGNATNLKGPNPTPALVALPGQAGVITQIAAGNEHSLALTSTGQLYAFGANVYGQLGTVANENPNPTPTLVTLPGQVGRVTQIAAGYGHTLVVTAGGQLYAFGDNAYGQLGTAANLKGSDPTPTPVVLPGQAGGVVQIAANGDASLAVTAGGQLYGFGLNRFGQLGSTTNSGTTQPTSTPAPAALPPQTTIDTLARGSESEHALALVSDLAIASEALPSALLGAPYSATLAAAGGAAPLAWSASSPPAGLSIDPGGAITGTPHAAGSFGVAFTATDAYGVQASRALPLRVLGPFCACLASRFVGIPTVTGARQTHSLWREGRRLASFARRRPPLGTRFSFTLNEPATVRFAFTQPASGRRVTGRCVAPTRRNAGARRCARTVTRAAMRFAGQVGPNKVSFQGRVSASTTLTPGRYTLAIRASAGGRTSAPAKLSFTIAR